MDGGMRTLIALTLGIAAVWSSACAHGTPELEHLRVENALLREELAIIRHNCDHYRGVHIEAEEGEAPQEEPQP